jgi:hypothetical protein
VRPRRAPDRLAGCVGQTAGGARSYRADQPAPNLWLKAIEELQADGLETTVARTRCSTRSTPNTPPRYGICPTARPGRMAAGRPASSRTAHTSSATWKRPSRLAGKAQSRHRTRSCTPPITAPWGARLPVADLELADRLNSSAVSCLKASVGGTPAGSVTRAQ